MLALGFGLAAIVLPQTNFFHAIPGDLGDARLNGLLLEHVYRWLLGADPALWSPGFFYPFPGALAFSDNHLGTVAIYALLRSVGLGTESAYMGWFTLAYLVNFLSCHYVLRRFGFSAPASAAGAFLYAFAMPVLVQSNHAQLGYRFAVPLAMLALYRFLRDGRPIRLASLAAWVALQFYCTIYVGYFLLLLIAGYLIALYLIPSARREFLPPHRLLAAVARAPHNREWWTSVALLTASVVALVALFVPYAYYAKLYGFSRNPAEIASLLPRPASYLLADPSQLWGRFSQSITGIPNRQEQQLFIGAAACALALIGVSRATNWVRVSALAWLLLVVLTLDIRGYSLYSLIDQLPLANAIRATGRVVLVLLLPLAVLVAAGVDRLLAVPGRCIRGRRALAVVLVAALGLECATLSTAMVPLISWHARLDALRDQLPAELPPDAIVFVPRQAGVAFHLTELDGMALAQVLGRATLNGYSGNSPPGYGQTDDACDDLTDRLTGYAGFVRGGMAVAESLAHRVVSIGSATSCKLPTELPARTVLRGALARDVPAKITLVAADMAIVDSRRLAVEVDVANASTTTIGSLSDSGRPVRFSWRFVAVDGPAAPVGWDARAELRNDVPAHGHVRQRLLIDAPTVPGRYRLQLSMVQEGVTWFHDLGMALARGSREVTVDTRGQRVELR